ncbi:kinase-like protein [Rhizophagus irregularis]|uniref:non-specific serine/threonine protein kinase n=1 Tax=Rhizophagus irregularis TaxID=588596 RepID=A0A2I1H4L3_9GLOM|nr:kinase-like protein [Rhizophagus irregularis]
MNLFSQQWHNLIVKDTHNIGYLCELMPDLSFFRKEDAVDDAYIPMLVQTILELKAQKTSTGFSNEEKGQLLDYIHILVRQQPLRKLFAIFLSNGSYFYVMPYDRDTNEYQQYETTFSNGLRLLHTLVSRNSDFIKAIGTRGVNFRSKISSTCVSPTKIYLEELLVEGSSAIVYRIKWRNSPAVIKSFKKVSDYNVLNEVEILQFLNDSNVQNIPEYVAHDDKNIIFYPVCSKIDKRFFRAKHARELLQVLERIHSLKIYHRDVRPSNIMIDTTNNSLILVDWGSAVRDPNGEVAYEGTSTYASPGILNNNMGLYKPRSADDLHSFVRTIYVLLNLNPLRKPRNLKSIAEIRNYWNRELNDRPFWTDMLTAADNENIEELKKLCDIV